MEQKHPHSQDRIQILTTLNENYLPRLQVLLTSMHVTQPEYKTDVWLIHSGLSDEDLSRIRCQCRLFGFGFYPVTADSSAFTNAPVSTQYPREMYYRLLAAQLLPDSLHRILYLDPDILVINSLRPLWEADPGNRRFNLELRRAQLQQLSPPQRRCMRHGLGHGEHRGPALLRPGKALAERVYPPFRHSV